MLPPGALAALGGALGGGFGGGLPEGALGVVCLLAGPVGPAGLGPLGREGARPAALLLRALSTVLGVLGAILGGILFPLDARMGCEGGRPDGSGGSDALAAWRAPTLPLAAGAGGGGLLVDDVGATASVRGRLLGSVPLPSLLLSGRFGAAPAEGPDGAEAPDKALAHALVRDACCMYAARLLVPL